MVVALLTLLLTAPAVTAPVCGNDGRVAARRQLLEQLNRAREAAGSAAVVPHPTVCQLARDRARRVRETGDPSTSLGELQEMVRFLYRHDYPPHAWTQTSIIGDPLAGGLGQWASLRPDSYREAVEGDFEHAGIGVETLSGQPIFTIVLALSKCTFERRRVAPLADLDAVRAAALAAVNRFRAEEGRPPVGADPLLDHAAQAHAEAMRDGSFYAHRGLDGSGPRERALAAGYGPGGRVAENIAKGIFDGAEVVERWMGSRGHRANLLDRKMRAVGLGVAVGESGRAGECVEVYWAQVFGSTEDG